MFEIPEKRKQNGTFSKSNIDSRRKKLPKGNNTL